MREFVILFLLVIGSTVLADSAPNDVQQLMDTHLATYQKQEHFSAIQVSIQTHGKTKTWTTGNVSMAPDSEPITANHLFDIGSITKSFTAALTILAVKEDLLKLDDTLGDYLNEYPHWSDATVEQMLNMSSGLPNYSNAPKINWLFSQELKRFWSPNELLNLVYPVENNPPRSSGYFYTNTGYVLMDLVLSGIYKTTYADLLNDKIIEPLGLTNLFYPLPTYPPEVLARMVHGYSYNIYDNPETLGRDVTENNLSWAGAAGGIVANSEDVVKWVNALFLDSKILSHDEQIRMQQMVSLSTGEPIEETNQEDPKGFGLGISQAFHKDIGRFWFYEGETLGYRALYMINTCNQVVVVALFNSATNGENDHSGELVQALYQNALEADSSLGCK